MTIPMSQLDMNQVIRSAYDDASGSLKTQLVAGVASEIEIAATDGDSVINYGSTDGTTSAIVPMLVGAAGGEIQHETTASGTLNSSYNASNDLVAEASAVGLTKFQVHAYTTSAITGSQVCTIQYSPVDTGDFWFASSVTVTPSTSLNGTASSTVLEVMARRVRVRGAAPVTSGVATVYLVGKR